MSWSGEVNGNAQTAYVAGTLFSQVTWIRMMAEAFKEIDAHRAPLNRDGPWTARTTSIDRYSRVNIIA